MSPSPSSSRSMYTRPCTLTHTDTHPCTMAGAHTRMGPRGCPGTPQAQGPPGPGPRHSVKRPSARPGCPGISCWTLVLGMLAPQRGPGEAAASGSELINPLGKEVLQHHPPEETQECVRGTAPIGSPEMGRHQVLGPRQFLTSS